MININSMSRDFNEVEKYLMTISPAIKSLKDVEDGESIAIAGYLEFTDVKDDGTEAEILSIITPNKEVYSCQSKTFKRSLMDIDKIMNGKPYRIIKISGVTNAGRPYINCMLDVDSITEIGK